MNNWTSFLKEEFEKEYFKNLSVFLSEEYKTKTIYPPKNLVFSAFDSCDLSNVKVVIIGQDPYHNFNEAHGLAFSVNKGIKIPPSLNNIYKELKEDLSCYIPNNGYLMKWSRQGVLLLNTILTVEENKPLSHANRGWEIFSDNVIKKLNGLDRPLIFILWGNFAKRKLSVIDKKHYIIQSAHPSPLSAHNGFFHSHPFSKVNNILIENNMKPIDWQIDNI